MRLQSPKLREKFRILWLATENFVERGRMQPVSGVSTVSLKELKIISPSSQGLQESKRVMI
jgi:hypothetical protein